jgi:hypothetical protein
MPDYPPPPPGDAPPPYPPPPHDPYAQEQALADWVAERGYELVAGADVRWYQAWYPFQYLFRIRSVGRELHLRIGEAQVWLVEGFEGDPVKQATGEDRYVYAFATVDGLAYRAALRSRRATGLVDAVSQGLGSLGSLVGMGASPPPVGAALGDPTFEARFDVSAPTRDEGVAALPLGLRKLLLSLPFEGIVEIRAKGLAMLSFAVKHFEPRGLEYLVDVLTRVLDAATHYDHAVTPPPAR